jgi:uncharacterized protein (TIGR03435 family)
VKIPDGTTKEQFKVMLQNLPSERFKVVLHREKKDFPIYELSVAKNGPKLKAAAEDPGAPDVGPQGPPPPGRGFSTVAAGTSEHGDEGDAQTGAGRGPSAAYLALGLNSGNPIELPGGGQD